MDDEIDDGTLLYPPSLPSPANTGRRQTMPTQGMWEDCSCFLHAWTKCPSAVLVLDDIDNMRSKWWDLNGTILVVLVPKNQYKQTKKMA